MIFDSEILCIHYYYPPIQSGGVIRNYYISREFAKLFKHVHVITTSNVDVMAQEEMDIPENVTIYKARTTDFRSVILKDNHASASVKSSRLAKIFIKLKKTLPFHFYIGEGGPSYIKRARIIGVEICKKHNISHLYSSFMPYCDHLIASEIKKRSRAIKWIADFRDLQVEPIYDNIYFTKWNINQERKILEHANLITTISEGLAKSMDYLKRDVLSIPRGIEMEASELDKYEKFTISYTGNLYQHYRDGKFFVTAFSTFINAAGLTPDQVQFIYAGRDSEIWLNWFAEAGIEDFILDLGFISRDDSRILQRKSQALLLLSSSSANHQGVLTGKLFEYLETTAPIINVINGVVDLEFEKIFEELEAGSIFYPDQQQLLRERLQSLYASHSQKVRFSLSEQALENRMKLSWNARVKTMLNEC